jgi:hypothetical protein
VRRCRDDYGNGTQRSFAVAALIAKLVEVHAPSWPTLRSPEHSEIR